jgi:hypothetical protein
VIVLASFHPLRPEASSHACRSTSFSPRFYGSASSGTVVVIVSCS